MRTLQAMRVDLEALRGCVTYTTMHDLVNLEHRLVNMETTLRMMHRVMCSMLEHEIFVREELTGKNDGKAG